MFVVLLIIIKTLANIRAQEYNFRSTNVVPYVKKKDDIAMEIIDTNSIFDLLSIPENPEIWQIFHGVYNFGFI